MTNESLFPPEIVAAAESTLDKVLSNCSESCGGTDALRQAAIKDIADGLMAERHRWFEAIDAHKDAIEALRKALAPFADVADFFDSETMGFSMEDTLQLVIENDGFPKVHVNSFCLQRFYTARSLMNGEEA